jgi:SAM-dependent methyltransferase
MPGLPAWIQERNPFLRPEGPSGRWAMAILRVFNERMNRDIGGELDLADSAQVLEIGFGPGVLIQTLLERYPRVQIFGVDPSDLMVLQARARWGRSAFAPRLDLRRASAEALPWGPGQFDWVISSNNIQVWDPLEQGLSEVERVVRPGGGFLVAMHEWASRGQGGPLGHRPEEVRRNLAELLSRRGWKDLRTEIHRAPLGRYLLLRGRWAPGPGGPPSETGSGPGLPKGLRGPDPSSADPGDAVGRA